MSLHTDQLGALRLTAGQRERSSEVSVSLKNIQKSVSTYPKVLFISRLIYIKSILCELLYPSSRHLKLL